MESNMWEQVLVALLPLLLLITLVARRLWMKNACKLQATEARSWGWAESPGLALELANSIGDVNAVLDKADTKLGIANRKAGALLQKLDFVFIPIYSLFFATAALSLGGWSRGRIVVAIALLTAISDVIEDRRILRMLQGLEDSPAKPFGQAKWFFYFTTLAAEGSLFIFEGAKPGGRAAAGAVLGAALIAIAVGGIASSLKGSFAGVSSATKLLALGLIALALAPLIELYPFSWLATAEYAAAIRVPLLLGTALFALPFIAFFS